MSTMTEGQVLYQQYLLSDHWRKTRDRAYKRLKKKCCQLCGDTRRQKNWHHIQYERRGMFREYLDIRWVCAFPYCHRKLHYILWIIPIPKTTVWLTFRYYQLKTSVWLWQLIKSYRV